MPDRICTVEGCTKPQNCRGWCKAHYRRWRDYGGPTGVPAPRPPQGPHACRVCFKESQRRYREKRKRAAA